MPTLYTITLYILRVNGPHNVGDPHNAGLGKWRCKTQSIHLQVDPLLPACTKTCNEDFPATIFYHSELFRPSRVTIDQIFGVAQTTSGPGAKTVLGTS